MKWTLEALLLNNAEIVSIPLWVSLVDSRSKS